MFCPVPNDYYLLLLALCRSMTSHHSRACLCPSRAQLHVKYPTSPHYYRQLSAYFMFCSVPISPSIYRGGWNHMSIHPSIHPVLSFFLATNNYHRLVRTFPIFYNTGLYGQLYLLSYREESTELSGQVIGQLNGL